MGFLLGSALELGTAEKLTAISCKAGNKAGEQSRGGRKGCWARKWREQGQQGSRMGQRSGEKAVLRRQLGWVVCRLGVVAEGHGKLLGMAMAATVELAGGVEGEGSEGSAGGADAAVGVGTVRPQIFILTY